MFYLLNTLPRHLLLFLIVFTPLAFGSVHVWAYSTMSFITLIIVGLMVANKLLSREEVVWTKSSFNILILVLLVYLFIQTLPLSVGTIKSLSPEVVRIHERLDFILNQELNQTAIPLSLNPHKSKNELLKLVTYLGIFIFIINQVRTRRHINQIIITIILVGVFETLYGMAFKQGEMYKIWWWEYKFLNPSRTPGTFINSNHLACYLEMAILLALGFALGIGFTKRRHRNEHQSLRETFAKMFQGTVNNIRFLLIVCAAIMFLGLVVSGSRGGLLAFCLGLVFMYWQSGRNKELPQVRYVKFIIVPLIILFGITLNKSNLDLVGKRYEDLFHFKDMDRVERFLSTQPLVQKFWMTGTGLGTFADVYPKYQNHRAWKYFIRHLHNDWLEWWIETGVIGFVLLSSLMLLYYLPFFRLWNKRKDGYCLGIGLGVMGCSFALFFHSFYDFNLRIPANAFLFSVILGIGFVALHSHRQDGQDQILCSNGTIKARLGTRLLLAGIAGSFLYFTGSQIINRFWSEALCPSQTNSTLKLKQNLSLKEMDQVLQNFPDYSECRVLWLKAQKEEAAHASFPVDREQYARKRIEMMMAAIRSNPVQASSYLLLGNAFFQMSLADKTNKIKWLNKSRKAYHQAAYFDPGKTRSVIKALSLWLKYSRKTPNFKEKEIYSEQAFGILREILQNNSEVWKQVLKTAYWFYPEEQTIKKVIPPAETSEEFEKIHALSREWVNSQKRK